MYEGGFDRVFDLLLDYIFYGLFYVAFFVLFSVKHQRPPFNYRITDNSIPYRRCKVKQINLSAKKRRYLPQINT